MKTIFVVDDNDTNLAMAKRALGETYRIFLAASAEKMFHLMEKIIPDLVLLDVEMPEMNGYQALEKLKADPKFKDIPVIFLTATSDPEAEVHGFELGAVDYITKPFSPPVLLKHINLHLNLDALVKERTAQLTKLHNAIINVLSNMVENRDEDTGGHIARTEHYLELLLNDMTEEGLYSEETSKWNKEELLPSVQLHDVGKIGIPDAILNKPGKLTEAEFKVMETHTSIGESIIDSMISQTGEGGDFLLHAKAFAGTHHEKWDGTGYPRGLKGNAIPLQGRMMAIVDVYDALTSVRPYKSALSHEEAVNIIKEESGTHFDPKLVDVFLKHQDQFKTALAASHPSK
jgi:putative two-component system response regulator